MRPIQLCALHAGCRCSPRGFPSQRPAEGCGARPREPPRPRVASRLFSVLIRFRLPALTVRTSGVLGTVLHRSLRLSAVPVDFCASRNAFGAGLTLGVCRRQPPASCRRLCAAAEGARGRGRRAHGRSGGQEPRTGAQGAAPRPALLPPGGDAPSCGLALSSEGCGSRVGPGPARAGPSEWERLRVLPSPGPRGVGRPCPGCRALSPGRSLWDLGGDFGSGRTRFVPRSSPGGVGWAPVPSVRVLSVCAASLPAPALPGRQSRV